MYRLLGLVVVLLVAAVGCQRPGAPESEVAGGSPNELLDRLRGTDICALLPRAELAKVGRVVAVGTKQLYGCTAQVGGERRAGTQVEWSVRAVEPSAPGKGSTTQIEGVPVSVVGDQDLASPEELARATIRTCTAYSGLPGGGSMQLAVTTPPGSEPCQPARTLVETALARWKKHPRLGDSPDTVRTAVTGKDPCAVLTALPGAVKGSTQWVDRCWFTLDGDSVFVGYDHSTDREFQNYQQVHFGDRTVHRTSGTANFSYKLRVGPPFDPVADDYDFLSVPAVTINGGKQEALDKAAAAVLGLFP